MKQRSEIGMRMFGREVFAPAWLVIAAGVIAVLSAGVAAQQQQPQGPSIEQRVGAEIGPLIVRAAQLAAKVDQLEAIVAQRDKTIAELQAQVKAQEAPK